MSHYHKDSLTAQLKVVDHPKVRPIHVQQGTRLLNTVISISTDGSIACLNTDTQNEIGPLHNIVDENSFE